MLFQINAFLYEQNWLKAGINYLLLVPAEVILQETEIDSTDY